MTKTLEDVWVLLTPRMKIDAEACNKRLLQNLGGNLCISRQNVRLSQVEEFKRKRLERFIGFYENGLTLSQVGHKTGDSKSQILEFLADQGVELWKK